MPIDPTIIASGAQSIMNTGTGMLGGLLNRRWALKDLEDQRRYNSPKEQVARLKEAGIPLAAMFQGQSAGGQSEQPRATEINPSLGTSDVLSSYMTTRLQQAQIDKLDAEAQLTGAMANEKIGQNKWLFSVVGDPSLVDTNQFRQLDADRKMKEADAFLKENQGKIAEINKRVQSELEVDGTLTETTRQQLRNLILNSDLMKQTYEQTDMRNKAMKTLVDRLEMNGMSVGEAFMHMLLTGGTNTNFIPLRPFNNIGNN